MARPVKFAHVVYMTRRYEAMIAWYDACSAEEGRALLRATDNPVGVMFRSGGPGGALAGAGRARRRCWPSRRASPRRSRPRMG
jgi:hypothetical protein